MSLGPFDLTGEPFLMLYCALFLVTLVAGFIIPRRLRPEGTRQRVDDADSLAYLAGGRVRFGDALVARLLATRALIMLGKDSFLVNRREGAVSTAERSVIALSAPIKWRTIESTLKLYAGPLVARLQTAGLLVSSSERADLRFWGTLPYLMLIAFGATKLIIGDMRDRPIGYLTALTILTAVFAVIRWFSIDMRTQAGRDAVNAARQNSTRLKAAPTDAEMGMAVALFGTGVLAASAYGDFHRLRSASDSGGSSSDSSGDGGGGGGGGCGGCGS